MPCGWHPGHKLIQTPQALGKELTHKIELIEVAIQGTSKRKPKQGIGDKAPTVCQELSRVLKPAPLLMNLHSIATKLSPHTLCW